MCLSVIFIEQAIIYVCPTDNLAMYDQKIDRAIDLLQVAIIQVEILKSEEMDKFTTSEIADEISKNIMECADLIRDG